MVFILRRLVNKRDIEKCSGNEMFWELSSNMQRYLAHFSTQAQKLKNIFSKKSYGIISKKFFVYFVKWNFLALTLKNFVYYTIPTSSFFLEKISYILGNGTFWPRKSPFGKIEQLFMNDYLLASQESSFLIHPLFQIQSVRTHLVPYH